MAVVPKRLQPVARAGARRAAPDLDPDVAAHRPERLVAAVRAVLALTDAAIALALGRGSIALLLLLPVAVSALTLAVVRRGLPARGLRRVGGAAMGADLAVLVALVVAAGVAGEPGAGAGTAGALALAAGWLTRTFVLLEGPARYGMAGAALTGVPAVAVSLAITGGDAVAVAATAMIAVLVMTAGAVVSALRRSAAQARGTRTRLEQAFAHAPMGLAVLDLEGTVLHANSSLAAMVGSTAEELQGGGFVALVEPGTRAELVRALADLRAGAGSGWSEELALRAGDGTVTWSLVGLSLVRDPADGAPQRVIAQVTDVSDQRASQQALQHEATHDRLTGLPGRQLFVERLSQALAGEAGTRDGGGVIAVLFCDLDGFKVVNDRYGHARGDQLLAITARRLAGALRLPTLAARWGGDEFVVLCDAQSLDEVRAIARRLVAAVSQPIADEDLEARVSMSVGIAVPSPGERDPYRVIDAADAAMYRAKQLGTGGWVVSDSGESVHVPVA